jgi:hypothetical protein
MSLVFRFDDVEVREREFTLIKAGKGGLEGGTASQMSSIPNAGPSTHFWCKSAPKFAQDDSSIYIANFRDGKLLSRLFFFFADGEVREREFTLTKAGEAQPVEPTGSRGLGARQWRRGDFVRSKSVTRRFDAPTLRSYNSYRSC